MTPSEPPLEPPDLRTAMFEDPKLYELLLSHYTGNNLALKLAFPAAISAVAAAATAAFGGLRPGALIAGALCVAQIPTTLACARHVRARDAERFFPAYLVASTVQYLWLCFLCWYSAPVFAVVGVMVFCAWAFNDARFLYNSPLLRWMLIAAFPLFNFCLLLVDAAGGNGLLAMARTAPGRLVAVLAAELSVALVAVIIVSVVGTREYRRKLADDRAQREHELAVARAERDALRNVSVYLAHGLAAAKFSHDIASPINVVTFSVEALRDQIARLLTLDAASPERLPAELAAWRDETASICDDLALGASRAEKMTRDVADTIKNPEAQEPRPVATLVGDALAEVAVALKGHRTSASPTVALEEAEVAVAPGHVGTLANLVTNAALQRPEGVIEVTGRAFDPWFYVLDIRDHGVLAEQRPVALEAITRALRLDAAVTAKAATGGSADRKYRGYGIALMMARVFVTRYGGAIGATAPAEGDGLVLRVVLPRVHPNVIPTNANDPEAALGLGPG